MKFYSLEVRAAACGALAAGLSARSVGVSMGIPRRTIVEWGMLSGMTFVMGRRGGAVRPPAPARARGEVSYRRLSLAGRSFIQAARSLPEPLSIRAIARELDVVVGILMAWADRYSRKSRSLKSARTSDARRSPSSFFVSA